MTRRVTHVLLTRFNLPSRGHESVVRARENWLRNRVGLFERYCLPSVLGQTCSDYSWLIYFDPHSPAWLVNWFRQHEEQGHFRPLLREEVPRRDLVADIRAVSGDAGGDLLTTNLDNDDSLAHDFVARVQSAPTAMTPTAVYLGAGLIVRENRLYRRRDPHNAFCSVRETWDDPVTCWSAWHNLLPRHMPAVVLDGRPGWLQVVHGANVSNRVRGRRARPSNHRAAFPGLLEDLPDPGPVELARDALVEAPTRVLRESGRATVKAAVGTVLGREGLDRVKLLWTSARRQATRSGSPTGEPSERGNP